MAKYRGKGYSNYFWDGEQGEAVDRLREIAKDVDEYSESDDLRELADELERVQDQIEDILYALDRDEE